MFSRFFVRRPVFAWVIAILIMLAGMLAIRTLPVCAVPGRGSAVDQNLRHLYRCLRTDAGKQRDAGDRAAAHRAG